jgi:hypothetical protein
LDSARSYLKRKARYLLLWAIAGLLVGVSVVLITPARYEASFLIKMPTANALNEFGVLQPHLIKVVPPAFDAKKLLLKPELFSNSSLAACGYSDTNANRKALVKSIYATEANYGSSVLVAVRIPSREMALRCANQLIADVIAFANAEKNNYVSYSLQVNKNSSASAIVNTDAALTAPVRISDTPVSPRPVSLVIGLMLMGLLLGLLIDWLRYVYALRNRGEEASH